MKTNVKHAILSLDNIKLASLKWHFDSAEVANLLNSKTRLVFLIREKTKQIFVYIFEKIKRLETVLKR